MTFTAEQVQEVMNLSYGSMTFFKRAYGQGMDYTEGVMEVQRRLNMYWFVDLMYSHMPAVLKDYSATRNSFYVVDIQANADHTALIQISREEYIEEDYSTVVVASQEVEYIDLPEVNMKFFLELANLEPVTFRLLCPSEH